MSDGRGGREVQPTSRKLRDRLAQHEPLEYFAETLPTALPSSDNGAKCDQLRDASNECSEYKPIRDKQAESRTPIQLAP